MSDTNPSSGNLLLATLSRSALRSLNLRDEIHPIAEVLIRADETPEFIYFPGDNAVISVVRATEDGWLVEAGVVGNEGAVHIQTILTAPAPTGGQALTQIEGHFWRAEGRLVRDLFQNDTPFRQRVLAFTTTFLGQVTQNLVCNRLHQIEQRLAKWLLIVRDRIDTDELHLTHEFLSHMLGIHRPGVSIAVTALEMDGMIHHGRNRITIADRAALTARSCECYAITCASLERLRSAFHANVRHHTDVTLAAG